MNDSGMSSSPGNIPDNIVEYVNLRIASAKLALVAGLSRFFGNTVRILFCVLFCALGIMALAVAFISWLASMLGSVALAALIVGVVLLIIGLIFLAVKSMFVNSMVKMFSDLVFTNRKNEVHED